MEKNDLVQKAIDALPPEVARKFVLRVAEICFSAERDDDDREIEVGDWDPNREWACNDDMTEIAGELPPAVRDAINAIQAEREKVQQSKEIATHVDAIRPHLEALADMDKRDGVYFGTPRFSAKFLTLLLAWEAFAEAYYG